MFGGSIDFWVMKEYGVADSWAKLFKFNVSIPSENIYESERLGVSDTSITLERANVGFCDRRPSMKEFQLIRSVHHHQEKQDTQTICGVMGRIRIAYDETLLRLNE